MTLQERLRQLVSIAPAGTLVPVESIGLLLEDDEAGVLQARATLSLEDVAARASAELYGGRSTPGLGAVRKWIRQGKDGVVLEAFGRPYVVTEEAWGRFVEQLRGKGKERPAAPAVTVAAGASAGEEISAFKDRMLREGTRGRGGE